MLGSFLKMIAREEAIRIAKNETINREWPWEQPIRASRGLWNWTIVSNADSLGRNVNVVISGKDGTVKHSGFSPR
jgi:hypothetical protein